MKKENLIDNCIRADLKIIESDLQILLLVWTALFALGLSFGVLLLAIPAIIAVLACLYNIFSKLYGSSLHGRDAVLYRALPVPVSTLVLSKIFTGGLVFASLGAIYYICIAFRAVIYNGDPMRVVAEFEGWMQSFLTLKIDPVLVPLAAVLDFLNMVVRCFTISSVILLGVTAYYGLPRSGKGWIVHNAMIYIGIVAAVPYYMMSELPEMMDWLQPAILQPAFLLALSLVLLAACYKVCVILISKKDGGMSS